MKFKFIKNNLISILNFISNYLFYDCHERYCCDGGLTFRLTTPHNFKKFLIGLSYWSNTIHVKLYNALNSITDNKKYSFLYLCNFVHVYYNVNNTILLTRQFLYPIDWPIYVYLYILIIVSIICFESCIPASNYIRAVLIICATDCVYRVRV